MSVAASGKLTASMEDYLEAILYLIHKDRVARVRDIARRLGVGMPSVSAALRVLSRRKLVNYDPYEFITLTEAGRLRAEEVTGRHEVLRRFLTDVLGMDAASAEGNACRLEHAADQALLERLGQLAEFLEAGRRRGRSWRERFSRFCRRDGAPRQVSPRPDRAAGRRARSTV